MHTWVHMAAQEIPTWTLTLQAHNPVQGPVKLQEGDRRAMVTCARLMQRKDWNPRPGRNEQAEIQQTSFRNTDQGTTFYGGRYGG